MDLIVSTPDTSLPSIFTVRPEARKRLRDFFSSHIRNRNTRRAYMETVRPFSAFCALHGIVDLAQVEPVHVAAFVEDQLRQCSKPTVKQRLAALRMLFDWMVVGQVLAVNPAHAGYGITIEDEALVHLSPIGWEHVNLTGDYNWQAVGRLRKGSFRPYDLLQPQTNDPNSLAYDF